MHLRSPELRRHAGGPPKILPRPPKPAPSNGGRTCARCEGRDSFGNSGASVLSRASSSLSGYSSSGCTLRTSLTTAHHPDGRRSRSGGGYEPGDEGLQHQYKRHVCRGDEEAGHDQDDQDADEEEEEDEEDRSAVLGEREMNSFQKTIPALRRHDPKTSTIRQHYYPEGGWGWVVCGCVFVIHILTTGMQYSFGVLYTDLVNHVGLSQRSAVTASWVGSTSLAVSRCTAPLVVALCRRKSTRLTAVIGGLVMALATLFASFALQLHQIFLSWSLVLGVGVGLTREAASLMLGQYFKRRREFVEMIVQTGSGVGITLFSVFFKEVIKSIGWRLGLQAVTGTVFLSFILGICYRSASLYHPQRRAILHLKNQKKRVKDKGRCDEKPPYFEMQCLKARSMQVLVLASAIFSAGLYAPLFFLILGAQEEGLEDSSLILLQTFLGFAYALGCLGFGLIVVRRSNQCLISRQYLCQAALLSLGAMSLSLTAVRGYHGYALFMWLYGMLLGGAHYALQMLVLERARARHFARAWGFMQAASAIPILVGVPITGYINEASAKSGYFFSSACTLAGASCLFFLKATPMAPESQPGSFTRPSENHHNTEDIPRFPGFDKHIEKPGQLFSPLQMQNGPVRGPTGPTCTCGAEPLMVMPKYEMDFRRVPKNLSFASSIDTGGPMFRPELLTCVSEEGLLGPCCANMEETLSEDCGAMSHISRYNAMPCRIQAPYLNNDRPFSAYRSQSLPRRAFQNQNSHSYHQISTLPRDGSLAMSCRRLGSSSGVSFSEPEGLARLGNRPGSLRSMSPLNPQQFPHHRLKLPSPPPLRGHRECPPLTSRDRTHPSILRRPLPPPPQQPQRRFTQMEERTTSV
ncbi:uncharacterized protein LOC108671632 [Hyalella azteca]|uniref:Uncharacterized protein LOC108671632 n=1 Tax=Hyalella azteca TaxID=294128 RepID=A0A979FKE3_HYAAZ|nr:uncharacterized protein LOC108671632 [Hyalella azteca]